MAEENEDLLDEGQENINKTEKRIKDLSEKVKLTSQERDDLTKAKEQLESEKSAALKEVDFYKDFSKSTAQYPASAEFQDKIKEKVMSGYTVEDATVSVLAKEGKLTTPIVPKDSPAGGSATTTIKSGDKTIGEMTQAERREELSKILDIT